MPRGDRTGPVGEGPRTGRGMGDCPDGGAEAWGPRSYGMGWGRGRGFGFGRGMGFGRRLGWRPGVRAWGWRNAPVGPEATTQPTVAAQELEELEAQASWLQQGLSELQARMNELKGHRAAQQE